MMSGKKNCNSISYENDEGVLDPVVGCASILASTVVVRTAKQ